MPRLKPVLAQRELASFTRLTEHGADLGTASKQVGGLATDDVEVLFLGDLDDAVFRELVQLSFDHPQRHVTEQPHDIQGVLRQRHGHRLDVQEVPGQHRDVVPPARVHRLLPSAQLRVIDDVVVDERCGMNELDDRRVENGARSGVAAQASRHQQDRGTNALAATRLNVAPNLGDDADLGLNLPFEFAFDRFEISADRFEHLNQVHSGFRGGVGQARQSDHRGAAGVNAMRLANSCGC